MPLHQSKTILRLGVNSVSSAVLTLWRFCRYKTEFAVAQLLMAAFTPIRLNRFSRSAAAKGLVRNSVK